MKRQIFVNAGFARTYQKLPEAGKRLVDAALKRLEQYLETGEASVGLGIKHLGGRTDEFRGGLALRAVYVVEGEEIFLALLGTHDEVRRFLRRR